MKILFILLLMLFSCFGCNNEKIKSENIKPLNQSDINIYNYSSIVIRNEIGDIININTQIENDFIDYIKMIYENNVYIGKYEEFIFYPSIELSTNNGSLYYIFSNNINW